VGTRCADHVTPLYPQKLALTSPTGGGRSVGIVRVRTKDTEFPNTANINTLCTKPRFVNKIMSDLATPIQYSGKITKKKNRSLLWLVC